MNNKSVVELVDYGKIEIHLKDILDSRELSKNYLAKAADTRFEVIKKWYDNSIERMDLDVLARICYVLDCSPSDIIKYNNCNTEEAL